jgi:phenylacetate-CoA ligase
MSPAVLKIYHAMPPWVQSVAASARGLQLRRWRYSAATEQLVREAHAREHWDAAQWAAFQNDRLRQLLKRARERVPHYRDYWSAYSGGSKAWEQLENWPILEKDVLRSNPLAFVADDCDVRKMVPEHTSGSSGKPLHLWWSRQTTHDWYGLFEARWKRWYGVSVDDRWGILGGQLVAPVARKKPPFWVWNAAMRQLYLSSFHLTDDSIRFYLDEIERRKLQYLWGYSSALYELAKGAIQLGRKVPLKVVIANAEPLYSYQRQVIAEAFCCPVRETYGMAEMAAAASECEHGRLHIWPEAGILEVLDEDGQEAAAGEAGDLVATGLFNQDMPLIRYRVGDRIVRGKEDGLCACGRKLPLLDSVEGRLDDMIVTTDGRRVGRLDVIFKAGFPIRGAQVIQECEGELIVKIVRAPEFVDRDRQRIADRFREYVGPMRLRIEEVSELSIGANGKFRGVISKLPQNGRSRAEKQPSA